MRMKIKNWLKEILKNSLEKLTGKKYYEIDDDKNRSSFANNQSKNSADVLSFMRDSEKIQEEFVDNMEDISKLVTTDNSSSPFKIFLMKLESDGFRRHGIDSRDLFYMRQRFNLSCDKKMVYFKSKQDFYCNLKENSEGIGTLTCNAHGKMVLNYSSKEYLIPYRDVMMNNIEIYELTSLARLHTKDLYCPYCSLEDKFFRIGTYFIFYEDDEVVRTIRITDLNHHGKTIITEIDEDGLISKDIEWTHDVFVQIIDNNIKSNINSSKKILEIFTSTCEDSVFMNECLYV